MLTLKRLQVGSVHENAGRIAEHFQQEEQFTRAKTVGDSAEPHQPGQNASVDAWLAEGGSPEQLVTVLSRQLGVFEVSMPSRMSVS